MISGNAAVANGGQPQSAEDAQLAAVLDACLADMEAGRAIDVTRLLAEHAAIAERLRACLASLQLVEQGAPVFGSSPVEAAGGEQSRQLGDFRILREIGRGGMGVVYEAVQVSLGRRVALKVLPFAGALDAKQLQRFKNEAQAAALLHHQNIVPVYYVGCERGVHFYAMQFIEGQTLAAVIEELRQHASGKPAGPDPSPGPLSAMAEALAAGRLPGALRPSTDIPPTGSYTPASPPPPAPPTKATPQAAISTDRSIKSQEYFRTVASLGEQAAAALEHAHQMGVVHRDIKPGNLLVDVRGNLWITDFGLAQFQTGPQLTMTGDLVGTLRYMSPEQALAKRVVIDHRTDIYSLGVTLYELLTLRPLFEATDRQELLRQIAFEEPRAPRRINSRIPAELETIVLKALEKNPAERFPTAQELADDLRRFLEDKPIRARRPTLVQRARKLAHRHKGLVMTGVGLLLLLALGSAVSTGLILRQQWKTQKAYQQLAEEESKTKAALEAEAKQRARAEKRLQKAREAVDVLAQVSEEELADKPRLGDLRRRLLEVTLVYYQDLIDESRDNPLSQADLTAAREQVAAILGELAASEDFGRVMFLKHLLDEKAVREDLQLSEDRAKSIRNRVEGLFRELMPSLDAFRQLSPDERRQKLQKMTQAAKQALAEVLTAGQVQRLKQIALQQRGAQALSDPEVSETLGLTTTQKQRIQTIQDEACKRMPGPPGPGMPRGGKPEDYWKATSSRLLGVLTTAQKARWTKMVGKKFEGEICPGFKGWFGAGPRGHAGPPGPRGPHHGGP